MSSFHPQRQRGHTAIIDAEIVVCDDDERPSFGALMAGKQTALCAWCFDLLGWMVIVCAPSRGTAGASDRFYRLGKNPSSIEVKTATWWLANRERYELFEKS
jgi:hypothetical protein